MTLMQRLSLFLAKRYLKVHHFRIRGNADNVIYATGDVLLSPNALRFFIAAGKSSQSGWEMEEVRVVDGQFRGLNPPKILKNRTLKKLI